MASDDAERKTWAVTRDGTPMKLSLTRDGLRLTIESQQEKSWRWAELKELSYSTSSSVTLEPLRGERVILDFASGAEQRTFRAGAETISHGAPPQEPLGPPAIGAYPQPVGEYPEAGATAARCLNRHEISSDFDFCPRCGAAASAPFEAESAPQTPHGGDQRYSDGPAWSAQTAPLPSGTVPPDSEARVEPSIHSQASHDRMWGMWAHLGPLVAGLVLAVVSFWAAGLLGLLAFAVPLVIMQSKGSSAFVRAHAVEALNFQIFNLMLLIPEMILVLITFGLFLIVAIPIAIVFVIFMIMGSVKASKGETYRYPVNIRLVK
jgi:uncharacterized protein